MKLLADEIPNEKQQLPLIWITPNFHQNTRKSWVPPPLSMIFQEPQTFPPSCWGGEDGGHNKKSFFHFEIGRILMVLKNYRR